MATEATSLRETLMRAAVPSAAAIVALLVPIHLPKAGRVYDKSPLDLSLFPAPIMRNNLALSQALGTIGAYVQGGYVLFGVELHTKDGNEPLVSVNLPPGRHLRDGLRQIMVQIPGYEYKLVSEHMINIYPSGGERDSKDLLNTLVPQFDAISVDPIQILISPSEYIPELEARLHPRTSAQPYGYGGVRTRSNLPAVTLHLKNTTVREILNAASEAMEEFPPQYQPVGWAYLFQPDPSLPAGGKHLWMFIFSAPKNWKTGSNDEHKENRTYSTSLVSRLPERLILV